MPLRHDQFNNGDLYIRFKVELPEHKEVQTIMKQFCEKLQTKEMSPEYNFYMDTFPSRSVSLSEQETIETCSYKFTTAQEIGSKMNQQTSSSALDSDEEDGHPRGSINDCRMS